MKGWILLISLFVFLIPSVHSQVVRLVDKPYECKGCDKRVPKISKKEIADIVASTPGLIAAASKIKGYFFAEGDLFMLFCDSCRGARTYFHKPGIKPAQQDGRNGLGTKSKGSVAELYSFSDLTNLLKDSLLVFDTLKVSLASMVSRNDEILSSLIAKYSLDNDPITRNIPYDVSSKTISLTYKTLFGNKLPRDFTDTIAVSLCYLSPEGKKIDLSANMKVYFASDDEKKMIKELYDSYKTAFPEWRAEQIAEEINNNLSPVYKSIEPTSFVKWLNNHQ